MLLERGATTRSSDPSFDFFLQDVLSEIIQQQKLNLLCQGYIERWRVDFFQANRCSIFLCYLDGEIDY